MTTFYLIRHAEAEGNLYRRIHGHYNSIITPNGMRQIRALAKRFSDIPVDACYTSDLLRTWTTAQAIYVPKGLEVQPDPAFRELNLGVWDDLEFGALHTYEPEHLARFSNEARTWQVEGSEPFSDYTGRYIRAMRKIADSHPDQTVAIFSHAAVTRGVIMELFPDEPITASDNTCVTKLEYENGQFRLVYLNDNSHLSPEISTLARRHSAGEGYTHFDNNFWFRPDLTNLDGLNPPDTGWCFTVMAGETPVGVLCLEDRSATEGQVRYMGLLPYLRGRGRSVQLLGRAVFAFREKGKETLLLQKPEDHSLDSLCRQMDLVPGPDGLCHLDIRQQVQPF